MPITYRTMTQYDLGGARMRCGCGGELRAGEEGAWATKYIGPCCSERCAKAAETAERRYREMVDTETEVSQ